MIFLSQTPGWVVKKFFLPGRSAGAPSGQAGKESAWPNRLFLKRILGKAQGWVAAFISA